jgi:hypothetical protein
MKTIFILLIGVCLGLSVIGQTQELEQLKLNIAKLAQLRLQLSQAKQGYQMLLSSYQQLREVGKENFTIHQQQLDALWQVNATVLQSPIVGLLKQQSSSLDSLLHDGLTFLKRSGVFTHHEQLVLQGQLNQYKDEMHSLLQRKQLLLTPRALQLREAERLVLLRQLAIQGDVCLEKAQQKISQQRWIGMQRKQVIRDRKMIQQLY